MTQLRDMNSQTAKQFSLMRRYLRDEHISRELALRVRRYLDYEVRNRKDHVRESDVLLLKALSLPLRMDIELEMKTPQIACHPMFYQYNARDLQARRKLCWCLMRTYLSRGDCLFTCGES